MNQKGNSLVTGILIVGLVVIAFVGIYFFTSQRDNAKEVPTLTPSKSIQTSNPSPVVNKNSYQDKYFSVEIPNPVYPIPTKVENIKYGGIEDVLFYSKYGGGDIITFAVQITPDTPSMHHPLSKYEERKKFGPYDSTYEPVIAGQAADIYQPTITIYEKGEVFVLWMQIPDTNANRKIAEEFVQKISQSFRIL